MAEEKNMAVRKSISLGKAGIFVKIAFILAILILIVICVTYLIKYSELIQRKAQLERQLEQVSEEIEELNYYIRSPMDEHYVKKFAKELLGLVPADAKVYIPENSR